MSGLGVRVRGVSGLVVGFNNGITHAGVEVLV